MKANFEQHMGVDEAAKRERRQGLVELAHPQHGLDETAQEFTDTTSIPGVIDVAALHS